MVSYAISLYYTAHLINDKMTAPFFNNFELNLDSVMVNNPSLNIVLCKSNLKLNKKERHKGITTHEGSKIGGVIPNLYNNN